MKLWTKEPWCTARPRPVLLLLQFPLKGSLNMNTFILLSPLGSAYFILQRRATTSTRKEGASAGKPGGSGHQERTLPPAPKSHQWASLLFSSLFPYIEHNSGTQSSPQACLWHLGLKALLIYGVGFLGNGTHPLDHPRGKQAQHKDLEYLERALPVLVTVLVYSPDKILIVII